MSYHSVTMADFHPPRRTVDKTYCEGFNQTIAGVQVLID